MQGFTRSCVRLARPLVGTLLLLAACNALSIPGRINVDRTCQYSAFNVSKSLFLNGWSKDGDFLFPLETGRTVQLYGKPWQACYGPGEKQNVQDIANGKKLPCSYKYNAWGNIDYQEEHGCDILLKTNCYCYSINRYVGSYCEPGLGGTGKSFQLPVLNCKSSVDGIIADGAVKVSKETVYSNVAKGNFIALAVKPGNNDGDSGDFHFWRLEKDGSWSYKAGDTLSRNSLRNGTKVWDVSLPLPRGEYTEFCGFFQVWPEKHKLVGNDYWYSNIPNRYADWKNRGFKFQSTTLPSISDAWRAAYREYFWDAGWEDIDTPTTRSKDSARLPTQPMPRKIQHWHSVRPGQNHEDKVVPATK